MTSDSRKKRIVLPPFFKRKFLVVSLLLIFSGIITVGATYAWFTLSTTPEVTGVTATIGANGSLEIALLNDETGENTSLIQANVGDSIYVAGLVEGNVTWGNLVDLSDVSYGLNTMVLYPSVINTEDDKLNINTMLSIPKMGIDGRINSLETNTKCAKYNGSIFTTDNVHYGVKGVGSVATGSSRSTYLTSAKTSFEACKSTALSTATQVIAKNTDFLLKLAISGTDSNLTVEDISTVQSLIAGLKTSLENILKAYKQVIIANVAANKDVSNSDFDAIRSSISNASADKLVNYTSHFDPSMKSDHLIKLANAIDDVNSSLSLINSLLYKNFGTTNEEPINPNTTFSYSQISGLINKFVNMSTLSIRDNIDGETLSLFEYAGEGIVQIISDYVGTYEAESNDIIIKAVTSKNNGNGLLRLINISNLSAPKDTTESSIVNTMVTDFYGYVVDLAFRTNVSADLRLQIEPVDRIYTDGAGATMGNGSKVIYTYTHGMNDDQINSLLSSLRACFFDPDTGEIFAMAKLGEVENNGISASSNLYLMDENNETNKLLELENAVPRKMSVLVYLDGNYIDNVSVFNGENSGSLLMNLQFSSSAELIPMVDSDLKNATSAENYEN